MLIAADRLSHSYRRGAAPILVNVSHEFTPGPFTAITGPSGSGKSTLLYLLALLLTPTDGAIRWDGRDVHALPDHARSELRARHVGFVFQDAVLDPAVSALDNVLEAAWLAGMPPRQARESAVEVMQLFGVYQRATHRPGEVSGGQAQRIALCRALVKQPQVIFADEPPAISTPIRPTWSGKHWPTPQPLAPRSSRRPTILAAPPRRHITWNCALSLGLPTNLECTVNSGHPRIAGVVQESLRRLRRPLAPTLVAVLIAAAGAIAVFATTGLALATQQQTINQFNAPSGRLISVTDAQGNAGMSAAGVASVASLSGVEWAFGVTAAAPVTNPALPGGAVSVGRVVYGELPPAIVRNNTRALVPGDALVGPGLGRQLGMASGVGPILLGQTPATVVGSFRANAPVESLNTNVLVCGKPGDSAARLLTMWVSVTDVALLPQVTKAVQSALVAEHAGNVQITTSVVLTNLSADVSAGLARSAQRTISGLLAAVTLLIAAVQFGRVTSMARDIGRRRALGASRSLIMVGIILNSALCGVIGALGGVVVGAGITRQVAGALPPLGFISGVGVLVVLAAVVGSLLPAIRAARMDPVRILRVP